MKHTNALQTLLDSMQYWFIFRAVTHCFETTTKNQVTHEIESTPNQCNQYELPELGFVMVHVRERFHPHRKIDFCACFRLLLKFLHQLGRPLLYSWFIVFDSCDAERAIPRFPSTCMLPLISNGQQRPLAIWISTCIPHCR